MSKINTGWGKVLFSDAIDVNPKREIKKGTECKFVSMDEVKEHNKRIDNFEKRRFLGGSKFTNKDTLMARITPCLENGKTAYVDILDSNEVAAGSTEFNVLAAKNGKTIPEFVYYLSITPEIREVAIKSMTGTSGRQRVDSDIFNKIILSLPSIPEQESITKVLSDLDSKIELNNQMNSTLQRVTQAIFKHWFIDFEFPNENRKSYKSSGGEMINSVIGKVPNGWLVKTIAECGEVICGKTPPTNNKENYGEDYLFITIPDMRNNTFVLDTKTKLSEVGANTQKKKELSPFAVCVSCIATPGLVSLTSKRSHTNQQINSIVCNSDISPYFMYLVMKLKSKEIKMMGSGGTATLNLNTGNFSKIKILIPPTKIMHEFNNIIEAQFTLILKNQNNTESLGVIRDSLLPKLISGEIMVPVGVSK